ncbi:hypothetical protein [Vitiosangium sp. GDMCC 1.1324]|uniref:hypothetical protein n=1 Tax=Vitiosangium sp. (strain GDMCC 1.1324) TaxID=2138576 RepID=UPI000D3A2245|nr:hypothetical protein [Vitiosangium sp. GDMCC 1.1324]PTL75504.1 hypothetical protein DAT35_54580 [Vitiosangium sp. GDMCC 1.1324]
MRRGWGFWVAVCLGFGCGAVVESPESTPPLGFHEQELQRGAPRHARVVEGSVFGRAVAVDRKGNAFASLTYERAGVNLGGAILPGGAGLALVKYAPDGQHLWSRGFPTYSGVRPSVTAMAVDDAGSLYIAGEHHEPSLSLGGEPLPPGPFLARYAPDGTHLWSHSASLPGVTLLPSSALAVDEDRGHLVVAVNFLDPGRSIGAALVGRVSVKDGGVLSLNPVVRSGSLSVTSLALDSSGNISVVGFVEGEVDLGGGPISTASPRGPFIARFSPEMRHQWSRGLWGAEGLATGVAVDSGRILVVGEFSGGFSFQGQLLRANGKDAFVAAYNSKGGELWAQHFAESATAVAVDGDNCVVVTGQYRPGESAGGSTLPFRAGGSPDNHLYVVKLYEGSGNSEWSRGLYSDGVLRGETLAVTRSGDVVLLPRVGGMIDVGSGPVTVPPESALFLRLVR